MNPPMHTSPTPADPPSRRDVLASIASAPDLETLFPIVSAALTRHRRTWGDEIVQSSAAAKLWHRASFVAAARPVVRFQMASPISQPGLVDVFELSGTRLVEISLESAKTIATRLLSPLAPFAPIPAETWREHAKSSNLCRHASNDPYFQDSNLTLARAAISLDLRTLVDKLRSCSTLVHAGSKPLWAAQSANSALGGLSYFDEYDPAPHERFPDWDRIASSCPDSANAIPALGASAFHELLEAGGFCFASASPSRGWSAACQASTAMAHACRDLSNAIGLPGAPVAGLGGVSIHIGILDETSSASFNTKAFSFRFGFSTLALAHEWTHGLDAASTYWGSPDMVHARELLSCSTRDIPPDPNAYETILADISAIPHSLEQNLFQTTDSTIEHFLLNKGHPANAQPEIRSVNIQKIHSTLSDISTQPQAKDKAFALLSSHSLNNDTLPSLDGVSALVDQYAWHIRRRHAHANAAAVFSADRAAGLPAFYAAALYADRSTPKTDLLKNHKPLYHQSGLEMIARVAEAWFVDRGWHALANPNKESRGMRPLGSERASATHAYGIFLECSRAPLQNRISEYIGTLASSAIPSLIVDEEFSIKARDRLASLAASLPNTSDRRPDADADHLLQMETDKKNALFAQQLAAASLQASAFISATAALTSGNIALKARLAAQQTSILAPPNAPPTLSRTRR